MKLYVVTGNSNDDAYGIDIHLLGVYDSKEKAECRTKLYDSGWYTIDITEIELNKEYNECIGYYSE